MIAKEYRMKFVKSLMSHAIEGTITFLAVIFAMGSFFWFESTWMKIRRVFWRIVSRLLAFIRSGKNQRRIIKKIMHCYAECGLADACKK